MKGRRSQPWRGPSLAAVLPVVSLWIRCANAAVPPAVVQLPTTTPLPENDRRPGHFRNAGLDGFPLGGDATATDSGMVGPPQATVDTPLAPNFTPFVMSSQFPSFTFPFASTPTSTDSPTSSQTGLPISVLLPSSSSSSSVDTTTTSSTTSTSSTPSTTSTSTTPTSTSTTSSSTSDPPPSSSTLFTTVTPSSSSAIPTAALANTGDNGAGMSKGTRTGIIGGSVAGGLVAVGLLLWIGTCVTKRRSDHVEVEKIAIDFDPAGHARANALYRNSRHNTDVYNSAGVARTYTSASRGRDPDLPDDSATPQESDPRELAEVSWDNPVPVSVPAAASLRRPGVSRNTTPRSGNSGSGATGRSLRNYTTQPSGNPAAYLSAIPPYPPRQHSDESTPSSHSLGPSVYGRDPGWHGQMQAHVNEAWGSGPRVQNPTGTGQWQGDEHGVLPDEDVYGGTTEDTLRRAMRGPSSYPTEAIPGQAV